MADLVLINPRFGVSFWGLEHALPLVGKKANLPVACLLKCAMHYHHYTMARRMAAGSAPLVNSF